MHLIPFLFLFLLFIFMATRSSCESGMSEQADVASAHADNTNAPYRTDYSGAYRAALADTFKARQQKPRATVAQFLQQQS